MEMRTCSAIGCVNRYPDHGYGVSRLCVSCQPDPAPDPQTPVKITVKTQDGNRYSLSGKKLESFIRGVEESFEVTQELGILTKPWKITDWDKED